jgi:solute carrier family 30 (zinc transporter), member 2
MADLLGHDHGQSHDHSHSDDHHSHHEEEHGHVHRHEHGHDSAITVTTHHHHHSSIGQQHDVEEPRLKHECDCESTQSGAKAAKKPQHNINVHS